MTKHTLINALSRIVQPENYSKTISLNKYKIIRVPMKPWRAPITHAKAGCGAPGENFARG